MGVLSPVMYMMGFLAGQVTIIAGNLVNWTLNLNSQILDSKAVEVGWTVSRDIANLGFVLAIIMIAFVTILRIETYQVKKLLVRLVLVALLVNFSLVFAGLFIDFSGVMTNFFLEQATSGRLPKLGEGLVNATKIHSVLDQKEDEDTIKKNIAGLADDWNKMVVFFTSLFFVAIFTIIVAISLLTLSVMFYIRYIALNLLLILMPIAWLLWIWPDTESHFKKWWGQFLHWVFFAPAVSFFLYLALLIGTAFKKNPIPVNIDSSATLIKDLGAGLGQMISVLGILWGGMYVANQMGVIGASVAQTLAGKVKGNFLGAVGGTSAWMGRGALRGALAGGVDEKGQSRGQRWGSALIGAGLTNAGVALHGAATSAITRGGSPDDVKAYGKKIEGLQEADLLKLANTSTNKVEQAAIVNLLAKKDLTGKVSPDRLTSLFKSASEIGVAKDILESRPDLAGSIGKTVGSVTQKIKAKDTSTKISEEALKNSEVALTLGIQNIEDIAKSGADSQKMAIIQALQKAEEFIRGMSDVKNRELMEAKFKERAEFVRNNTAFQPFLSGIKLPGESATQISGTNVVSGINLTPPPAKNS